MSAPLLVFGDLHLHPQKPYSRNAGRDRADDGLDVLDQICTIASVHACAAVLFGGDFAHVKGSLDTQSYAAATRKVSDHAAPWRRWLMEPGNHDHSEPTLQDHALSALHGTEGVTLASEPRVVRADAYEVMMIPWMGDGAANFLRGVEHAAQGLGRKTGPRVLLGHAATAGAIVGADFVFPGEHDVTIDELAALRERYEIDAIFLSHFHKHQQLADGVWYVGATHQHTWGDTGQARGCVLWSPDGGLEHVPLRAPRFVKGRRVGEWAFDWEEPPAGNFCRLETPEPMSARQVSRLREETGARAIEAPLVRPTKLREVVVPLRAPQSIEDRVRARALTIAAAAHTDPAATIAAGVDMLRDAQALTH